MYFRLFDVDQDGKISKNDIREFLAEIFKVPTLYGNKSNEEENEVPNVSNGIHPSVQQYNNYNNKNLKKSKTVLEDIATDDNDTRILIESIVSMIFDELIFDKKKKYILFEEFKPIMIGSNLEKTCSINFAEER